jgi:hypothetical protein
MGIVKIMKNIRRKMLSPVLDKLQVLQEDLETVKNMSSPALDKLQALQEDLETVKNTDIVHTNFLFDCSFESYQVEYESSPEDMRKLLSHIETVWSNYGKNEAFWSVLVHDKFLKKTLTIKRLRHFTCLEKAQCFK